MACKRSGVRISVAPRRSVLAGHRPYTKLRPLSSARRVWRARARARIRRDAVPAGQAHARVTESALARHARGHDPDHRSPQVSRSIAAAGYLTGYRQAAEPAQTHSDPLADKNRNADPEVPQARVRAPGPRSRYHAARVTTAKPAVGSKPGTKCAALISCRARDYGRGLADTAEGSEPGHGTRPLLAGRLPAVTDQRATRTRSAGDRTHGRRARAGLAGRAANLPTGTSPPPSLSLSAPRTRAASSPPCTGTTRTAQVSG